MNWIGRAHRDLTRLAPEITIDLLAGGDVGAAVDRAIESTPPRRRSPLHPALVVWLCLAMALFRADSIPNVFLRLLARARGRRPWLDLRSVNDGALAHARERLGPAPLHGLFEEVASHVAPAPTFAGLRVWALDGVVLPVADTPANEKAWGRHHASKGRSAFPALRLVTLTSTSTREIRAAEVGPYRTSEMAMAAEVSRCLGNGDLVLLDRGFMAAWLFARLCAQGADYVARLRTTVQPRILARRGPGDFDAVLFSRRREGGEDGPRFAVRGRLIEYRMARGPLVRLFTSLTDPAISAREIAGLYHERWEVETAFDEMKTHLASVRHGALHLPLRGKSPALVEQELWATLVTYNLVRRLIADAGRVHRVDPRRISFTDSVAVITATWGARPLAGEDLLRAYVRLIGDLAGCVLPRWRRPRRWPRVVRIRTARFPHKAPFDRETNNPSTPTLAHERCA